MTLLDTLLDAIVRLEGEALVMHVGEKPYVVTSGSMNSLRGPLSWGQVELSSRALTSDAVLGMLGQMLPADQWRLLDEIGAIEHEIDAPGQGGERFVVTAARGGEDVWVEVRRKVERPAVEAQPVPTDEPAVVVQPEPIAPEPEVIAAAEAEPVAAEPAVIDSTEPESVAPVAEIVVAESEAEPPVEFETPVLLEPEPAAFEEPERITLVDPEAITIIEPEAQAFAGPDPIALAEAQPISVVPPEPVAETDGDIVFELRADAVENFTWTPEFDEDETADSANVAARSWEQGHTLPAGDTWDEIPLPDAPAPAAPVAAAPAASPISPPETTAAVLPISRPALKLQTPPLAAPVSEGSLVELVRAAAARGASALYAVADSRPMVRVDGGIELLGTEPSVATGDVERFAFEYAPRDHVEEAPAEWTCSIRGVGRVRCVAFHDDSGAGLIVHLPSADVSTADELGLSERVQALSAEADGLVVVAGPRASGKSTLLDAFVDLIDRTRNDHVITIESQVRTVHEKRHSFISQRQVRGDGEAVATAVRAALREGPDVIVIEDLSAPEAIAAALDAARAGRLVFGSIAAPSAPVAVERLIGAFPADRRAQVRALLAGSLRAVLAQTLVRKAAGGRAAARELLLGTPGVANLILDGATAQLAIAIEGGRRLGMNTLIDSLGALVREGSVQVSEACRVAPDRAALVAALERDGIQVSDAERRA